MHSRLVRLSTAFVLLVTAAAAGHAQGAAKGSAGWTWLFNGTSTEAWRGYKMSTMPAGWSIANGTLTKKGTVEDLISKGEWANFELAFEWKLGPGGNSGVFYRASEEYPKVYWSGTEYQLLDDARHPDGKNRLTAAAAAYGLYPSPAGIVKPADQWNTSRIVAQGTHVEHWLNGKEVVEYDYGSADWTAKVKASKFAEWPDYGKATKGHIAIQGDHDGVLSLRNIRIRELSLRTPK